LGYLKQMLGVVAFRKEGMRRERSVQSEHMFR
jgi:hypothetical protein